MIDLAFLVLYYGALYGSLVIWGAVLLYGLMWLTWQRPVVVAGLLFVVAIILSILSPASPF